jgi:hypothetical protein
MKMSFLMIDDTEVAEGDLVLHDADFPDSYVHMKHPEDGVVVDGAIEPEFIRHKRAHHHRLLLRVSFRLANGKFAAFTFVCDTGAPDSFYLSSESDKLLADGGRRLEDEAGNTYIEILGQRAATRETPRSHQPGNIIGLSLLERLGLSLEVGRFRFVQKFDYL